MPIRWGVWSSDKLKQRKGDKNPLMNFIYYFSRNKKIENSTSVDLLIDTPLHLVDWPIEHTKRENIEMVHTPVLMNCRSMNYSPPAFASTFGGTRTLD
ncbi:MAG TPA: hypothetical protein VJ184_16385 [Chryseolinea sp.]|nr:hypothetical protein [Chryseolinea sp.]